MNKFRILLVDADPDRLEQFSSMLGEDDHNVLPVISLEEAEEALFVLKIDVVIFGSLFPEAEIEIFVDRLRGIENTQKNALRAPVLAVSPDLTDPPGWAPGRGGIIDGYLTRLFDSGTLSAAMAELSPGGAAAKRDGQETSLENLPIFEPDKFRQQVAYDPDLTVEIIELFLEERKVEVPEMQAAIENGQFQRLSEVAHTIKGSLSSLHAALARDRAQELETAAKKRDGTACRRLLGELAEDLDVLEPLLLRLRDEVKP